MGQKALLSFPHDQYIPDFSGTTAAGTACRVLRLFGSDFYKMLHPSEARSRVWSRESNKEGLSETKTKASSQNGDEATKETTSLVDAATSSDERAEKPSSFEIEVANP